MPSTTESVSLVPPTAKAKRNKQRPGFRPVAKPKKTSAAIATKLSKPAGTTEVDKHHVKEKSTSNVDYSTAAAATTADKKTPTAEISASKPSPPSESLPAADNEPTTANQEKPAAVNQEATADVSRKESFKELHVSFAEGVGSDKGKKRRATAASAASSKKKSKISNKATAGTPSSPRRSARKRKQTVPSSIQIGITRDTASSAASSPRATETETSRQEKQQNAAVAAAASAVAAASTSTAIVAVSQDQDVLERLGAEESQGPKLTAFCSAFKSDKKEARPGKRRKSNQGSNNEEDAAAADNNEVATGGANSDDAAEAGNEDPNANQPAAPAGVPVVQIIDGEIVLQESSLMLPTRRTVQEVEEEFQDNIVEEDAQLAIVQASYNDFLTKGDAAANGGKRGPTRWSLEETNKFFVALRQLGTDFGSMEAYFDNKRTRRQLKNKYRKELRKNPKLIEELALNPKYKTEIDVSAFDIEVDPGRIEAFENEELPPYEPTDLDENQASETEKASNDDQGVKDTPSSNDVVSNQNEIGEEGFMEEVIEDAIEERRKEAEAAEAEAVGSQTTTTTRTAGKRKHQSTKKRAGKKATAQEKATGPSPLSPKIIEHSSLWPDASEEQSNADGGEMDTAPMEPSMEEFFDDQIFGAPIEPEEQPQSNEASFSNKEASTESGEVLLLPKKKAASKAMRPKIRPSIRKKKK